MSPRRPTDWTAIANQFQFRQDYPTFNTTTTTCHWTAYYDTFPVCKGVLKTNTTRTINRSTRQQLTCTINIAYSRLLFYHQCSRQKSLYSSLIIIDNQFVTLQLLVYTTRSSPRCRKNDCCLKKIVQIFSLLARAIAWDWPLSVCWVSLFTVECSQHKPDLSNSFLYLLLANNTVRGLFALGYWLVGRRPQNFTYTQEARGFGTFWYFSQHPTGPL